jgi:hypothetical protein
VMGNWLFLILIGEYFILMMVYASQANLVMTMYWLGALILNIAVYLTQIKGV